VALVTVATLLATSLCVTSDCYAVVTTATRLETAIRPPRDSRTTPILTTHRSSATVKSQTRRSCNRGATFYM